MNEQNHRPGLKGKRRSLLRNEDGSALADAMFGIIVVIVGTLGLSGIAVQSANAVYGSVAYQERTSTLRTMLHDGAGTVAEWPVEAATETVTVGKDELLITRWAEPGTTATVLFAATAGTKSEDGSACTNPTDLGADCIVVELPVPVNEAGIHTDSVAPTWVNAGVADTAGADTPAGPVGTFTPAADVTEVRYVIKLGAVTAPGELTFNNAAGAIDTIWVDEATTGFIYGSLPVTPGDPVTINLTGAAAHLSNFYVYEAPR